MDHDLRGFSRALDDGNPFFWGVLLAVVVILAAWVSLVLLLMAAKAAGFAAPLGHSSAAELLYLVSYFEPGEAIGKSIAFVPLFAYFLFKLGQAMRYLSGRLRTCRAASR